MALGKVTMNPELQGPTAVRQNKKVMFKVMPQRKRVVGGNYSRINGWEQTDQMQSRC